MMDPRKIILPFSGLFPFKGLINRVGERLIFPFYHAVSDSPPSHLKNLYRIKSQKEFENDIDLLLLNFEALSPDILLNINEPVNSSKPSFILSFDDGLREVKETIVPILKRKGVPAIFFLNNNFIDNKALFFRYKVSVLIDYLKRPSFSLQNGKRFSEFLNCTDKSIPGIEKALLKLRFSDMSLIEKLSDLVGLNFDDYLKKHKPYLSDTEIKDIIKEGFYIGSHSFDHPYFTELSEKEQLNEIVESSLDIKERFKLNYSLFAFPFSDDGVSRMSLRKLHNSEGKPDASFGTSGLQKRLSYSHYQRIAMEKTGFNSNRILKTEYIYYLMKSLLYKN